MGLSEDEVKRMANGALSGNSGKTFEEALLAERQKNMAGPGWQAGYDPTTMSLAPGAEAGLNNISLGGLDQSMNALRGEALRKGPSAWANMANIKAAREGEMARGRGMNEVAGTTASARSQLAQQGGLSSGARERTAETGAKNAIGMNQDLSNQEINNKMQIGLNDEQNRMQQLSALPGAESAALAPQFQKFGALQSARQADIQNQLAENQARNKFNLGIYGANKTAEATEASKGGVSFICTAIREQGYMTQSEAKEMFSLMKSAFYKNADFINWYFRYAQKAVLLAKRQNFDFGAIKKAFITDVLHEKDKHGEYAAQQLYARNTVEFVKNWVNAPAVTTTDLGWKNCFKLPQLLFNKDVRKWIYDQMGFTGGTRTRKTASYAR